MSAEPLQWTGPLTLEQAIRRAQNTGFDVRTARADADASVARIGSARSSLLPQLGIAATASNGGITQLGMPLAQQTYLSANASLPIFTPSYPANKPATDRNAVVQNGLAIGATFDPNPPTKGADMLMVRIEDAAGAHVKGAVVKISSSIPSMSMGGPNALAVDNGDGSYTAHLSLQYATDWKFAISVASGGKTARMAIAENVR
ncbi:MAG: TolC family protein [Candidatus Baltobacteraceae bacterium]